MKKRIIAICLLIFCVLGIDACSSLSSIKDTLDWFEIEIPEELLSTDIKNIYEANNQCGFQMDGDWYVVFQLKEAPSKIPAIFANAEGDEEWVEIFHYAAKSLKVPAKYRPERGRESYRVSAHNGDYLDIIYQPHSLRIYMLVRYF